MNLSKLFATFCSVSLLLGTISNRVDGGMIIALNQSNELFRFDSASPGFTSSPTAISGLLAGDSILGIDGRPSDGKLYALAGNGSQGRVYSIDANTGIATLSSTLTQSLSGSFYGVNFNPVVDRLRVVSDAGQNLRVNVDTGATTIDTSLNYAAGDANAGTSPAVLAAAYTNTVGAISTTLYDLESATQSLVIQNPPNAGTLNTVGALGSIAFPGASFDIDGITNTGYVVLNGIEFSQLNLTNGNVDFIGNISSTSNVIGIATEIAAVPEPTSLLLFGLSSSGLLWFRSRKKLAAK